MYSEISDLISTVGFPIVCFLICGWYVKYREDKNDDKYAKLSNQHNEEIDQLVNAINHNTLALYKLLDKLDHDTYQ